MRKRFTIEVDTVEGGAEQFVILAHDAADALYGAQAWVKEAIDKGYRVTSVTIRPREAN